MVSLRVLRLGFLLALGVVVVSVVAAGGGVPIVVDWFRACTTALAASEAWCCCRGGSRVGVGAYGGASWKLSYAFSVAHESFHRFRN